MSGQLKRRILDDQNHDDLVGPPGGGPAVGPWQNFIVDPGWTSSTLRYRMVLDSHALQFEGLVIGTLGAAATARLGMLPPGYYPNRQQVITAVTVSTPSYAFAFVAFQPTGDVLVWYSAAGTQLIVSGIVAMD